MNITSRGFILYILLSFTTTVVAQELTWPVVEQETKPWTRWWWHGSAVDEHNIDVMLDQLKEAGFGGVEITPIYGVKGQEEVSIEYLSKQWVDMLQHTLDAAASRGMAVDLPPGSGWRCGGPFVTLQQANASLRIDTLSIKAGVKLDLDLSDKRVIHIRAIEKDSGLTLEMTRRRDENGHLQWTPETGDWILYVVRVEWSGGKVKRPGPGGEGYSIDVYSEAASQQFLDTIATRLASIPQGAIRSYFHDSFEYMGDGTAEIFSSFLKYRGYGLQDYIPALMGQGDPELVLRIQADYRKTLSDMLHDNFIAKLTTWSHEHGSLNRNQAHGSPGNMLDLYGACDIPETEIFGPLSGPDADVLINKFASSAAHVMNKPLASAEASTWLGEHFTVGLDSIRASCDHLFLAGINHLIFQGTAYSPEDAAWPGWVFYASVQMNPRNPYWKDIPKLTEYITNCQSVLQTGKPDNDVLIFWPYDDIIHEVGPLKKQLAVHHPDWFYNHPIGDLAQDLSKAGVSFDYISDRQLTSLEVDDEKIQAAGQEYQAIIVPETQYMTVRTFQEIVEMALEGATVIFQNDIPSDVSGFFSLESQRSAFDVLKKYAEKLPVIPNDGIVSELASLGVSAEQDLASKGIEYIRRATEDGYFYFLKNSTHETVEDWTTLAYLEDHAAFMDPMTGKIGRVPVREGDLPSIFLQMPPGGTMILYTSHGLSTTQDWGYTNREDISISHEGPWQVSFVQGGPALPGPVIMDGLRSWTAFGSDYENFSGTARYKTTFHAEEAGHYILDLGKVGASATITWNGREHTVIDGPFEVLLEDVKAGENTIEVLVTNLPANRIRYMDKQEIPWRIFHDINFVNIDYRPFDASNWEVKPSGILGPVTLTKYSIVNNP